MTNKLTPKFVEFIPPVLKDGVLYVAMECGTVVHLCCCGCGRRVVTPLSPADWKLTFDGDGLTLHPSIGNWQYPCRSHYWIRNSTVVWVPEAREDDASSWPKHSQRPIKPAAAPVPRKRKPLWSRFWP